ncbi:hypothetical protein KAFR_0G01450 [Kazachstania africana CBS 2517]|uniref:25S rRNA adenine-N(1) methyltransferase n=1 Tax=Kazachstania africana (strain ATCC 22294 / BCRC 22015 / CBS 2517 / CECT 1963 / NBRC 1671 / NRRL Y-8276) TaxID=1071382 RepID=H2AXS9_KAZAF|nr:hypothetical protein KAFR_0G01450 [Kazachstania africana CBS 2517]CCF59179.1 hypothetical protein KAFR_0G01450 [Kazachstania africana CBS 2517]
MIRKSRSITGKLVGPNTANLKRIKPELARKIIRRYHFMNQRKQKICSLLGSKDVEMYRKHLSFEEGWNARLNGVDSVVESVLRNIGTSNERDALIKLLGYIMKEVEDEMGLANYQFASRMGQDANRGGDSSKILVQWIRELIDEGKLERNRMKALEIGSLSKMNKISTSGIFEPVVRIDLNNSNDNEGIIRQDFMKRPIPTGENGKFDLISCSLVLNFVAQAIDRGRMLRRFKDFLKGSKLIFIVLPLPCMDNSRYMDTNHFKELMEALGYDKIRYYKAKKLCYFLFKGNGERERQGKKFTKKLKLHDGPNMNNFTVLFPDM